jgi:hypothetical protein
VGGLEDEASAGWEKKRGCRVVIAVQKRIGAENHWRENRIQSCALDEKRG